MKQIESEGKIFARVIRQAETLEPGLNFFSEDDENVQISIWNHENTKVLDSHVHKPIVRETIGTQEVVYVIKGKLHFDIYDNSGLLIAEDNLLKGDILICIQGGHGYQIIEPGTQVLEVKNGPYFGVELDKFLIPNHCSLIEKNKKRDTISE